jgi:nucleotide-binding universal stress UspA family protein
VVGAADGASRGRHRLGSTTTELLHSDVPVVLVPRGARKIAPETGITRLTVAIGTRPGADALIAETAALAGASACPVRLLSLLPVDLPPSADTGRDPHRRHDEADEVLAAARAGPRACTPTSRRRGRQHRGRRVHLDWQAGEIVLVGSSRLAQPRRLFLGSTAAKMLHEITVPVIVVPPPTPRSSTMSAPSRPTAAARRTGGLSSKGLSAGTIGLIGAVVIGISCIAPAYTFTAAVGPTASAVGAQIPAIILVGFIPMLLVAFGYRELNNRMPDAGTSFTWARARSARGSAGWPGGASSSRRSSCCRTSPASRSTSCSCCCRRSRATPRSPTWRRTRGSTSACACCSCSRRPSSRTATCRPPRSCSTCS